MGTGRVLGFGRRGVRRVGWGLSGIRSNMAEWCLEISVEHEVMEVRNRVEKKIWVICEGFDLSNED